MINGLRSIKPSVPTHEGPRENGVAMAADQPVPHSVQARQLSTPRS